MIGQSYFKRNQTILNARIQQSFTRHLREETYKSLIQANWSFFLKKRKSDISNTMTKELSNVSGGTKLFLQMVSNVIFTFIQIGLALLLSARMTLFVLFFGLVLTFVSRKLIKKAKTLGRETTQLSKTYLAGLTDHFNGIKDIKSNTLEETHLHWFQSLCQQMEFNKIEFVKLKQTSQFNYKIASAILIALFILVSVQIFHSQPAQLLLITIIFTRIWPKFTSFQANMEDLSSMIPSFESLMNLQNESRDAKELKDENHQNLNRSDMKQEIELIDISFCYNPDKPAYSLQNINVKIPANRMTAIVGRSGAGKSTLIDIIMGLNQPERGQIWIDGTPVSSDQLLSLRQSISYVPQDPFLFNASIRENLLLIEPRAEEEQLWKALEFSSAVHFVRRLPQGLDTLIGDRGISLSGGERQRLVLARAILRKPSILILDEATSALDMENEETFNKPLMD